MGRAGSEPVFALTIMTGRVIKFPQGKKITFPSQGIPDVHAVLNLDQHVVGVSISVFRSFEGIYGLWFYDFSVQS
jgi:hypothetical protein